MSLTCPACFRQFDLDENEWANRPDEQWDVVCPLCGFTGGAPTKEVPR